MKITQLSAVKNLSSWGNETIKVTLELDGSVQASLMVPAGISAGKYEAKIVSADEAIAQVEKIKPEIITHDWTQNSLDAMLGKNLLAGNTTIAISAAFWKAENVSAKKPKYTTFPKLLLLLFEGAKHGNPNLTIQEFMLVEDSLQTAIADFKTMRSYLTSQGIETTVGAEGGFSPMNFTNLLVLEVMHAVFPNSKFALDAAGSFRSAQLDFEKMISEFNLTYIEDPYSDEDWQKWQELMQKIADRVLIVGDDLTTTNPLRVHRALEQQAINAVIIKPNQNGTVSGTLEAVKQARDGGLKVIVSHRGEETDDDWIVDFALSVHADYVKFGGMDRGERVAKYNRLLELGMH